MHVNCKQYYKKQTKSSLLNLIIDTTADIVSIQLKDYYGTNTNRPIYWWSLNEDVYI